VLIEEAYTAIQHIFREGLYLTALQLCNMVSNVGQDRVIWALWAGALPLGAGLSGLCGLPIPICSVLNSTRTMMFSYSEISTISRQSTVDSVAEGMQAPSPASTSRQ